MILFFLIFYKNMFMLTLMTGTMISISAYSWMGMWMGLEINLLSIIPLMSSPKNMMTSEAALKYFIVQTMASTLLLFTIIMLSLNFMYNIDSNLYFNLVLNTTLLTKMGAAPFHFWFPEVMEGLNWNNSMIMLTIQKIAPMILMTYNSQTLIYLVLVIISSMMVSGIMGLNQTSMRKILTYSSINHIGWMIAAMLFSETVWWLYFWTYTMISINIILMLKLYNIFYLKQLFITLNKNFMIKLFFMLNFLSLGGIPPFLGFMPKWITIQMLVSNSLVATSVLMILMTLMTLYFYIRVMFTAILLNMNQISYYKTPKISNFMLMSFNFITITGLMLCTLSFNYL